MTRSVGAGTGETAGSQAAGGGASVRGVSSERRDGRGGLIAMLEAVQAEQGYLPEEALRAISRETGRSLVDIYGVATFYRSFSLRPRGKHLICACLGTACHVRGAPVIVEELERHLGIKAGNTTPDNEFTLETANCLGACALGPMVVIDGRYFSKVRKSRVRQLLDDALKGFSGPETGRNERMFPLEASCPGCGRCLMDQKHGIDGHPSILLTVSVGGKRGWLRMSSLYGSSHIALQHGIAEGTVARFFCPHCRRELSDSRGCPVCRAPMASLSVRGGAALCVCLRRGCEGRLLDLAPSAAPESAADGGKRKKAGTGK